MPRQCQYAKMADYQLARYLLCPTDGGLYKIGRGLFSTNEGGLGVGYQLPRLRQKGVWVFLFTLLGLYREGQLEGMIAP